MLLITGGHCQLKVTSPALRGALEAGPFLTKSSINKRQTTPAYATCITNNLQSFLANYPQNCTSRSNIVALSSALQGSLINSADITTAYGSICEPRCGNPLIAYYIRCNAPQEVIDAVRSGCARNDAGRLCYEQVASSIFDIIRASSICNSRSTCRANCRNALNTASSNSGCCINVLNITTLTRISQFTALQNSVWSGCGVDTPGFCNLETSTLSSAEAPKFVKVLFLLTLVVMAMLLL